ncbi:AsnC family transcriptional regulator [Chitinophaga caeni]|uniref:AsnC family transcriptional regulator n=1 Tax=Chitinophaga caeni TaxID=2029983 RepID=A0A291R1C8_9BACT|nr:AsnC family transcriptional regulator [Chitinophaga caeni]
MASLDRIDKRILQVMQSNAKLNTKEIAHRVGLTITPTYERIKKIEKLGIIKQYVTLLDREKVGKTLMAFCSVSLQLHSQLQIQRFEEAISHLPAVMECYHVAGQFDYLLKVVVDDMNQYQRFITQKLAAIENIGHVHSSFVMTEVKHDTAFPLDVQGD